MVVLPTIHIANDQSLIRLRTTSILLEVGRRAILCESHARRACPWQVQGTLHPGGPSDVEEILTALLVEGTRLTTGLRRRVGRGDKSGNVSIDAHRVDAV